MGRGVLIRGASGSGKSALALELMAHGAQLVADDCTVLVAKEGRLIASCPDTIRGRIEARGVGILKAEAVGPVPVALLIDLDRVEEERLPPLRSDTVLGVRVPLLRNVQAPYFSAAILPYLKGGVIDPDGDTR